MTHIWALFSIENQYNQPPYNLEVWYADMPPLEELFRFFNVNLADEDAVAKVVNIFTGGDSRIGNVDYRLQKVDVKQQLKNQ